MHFDFISSSAIETMKLQRQSLRPSKMNQFWNYQIRYWTWINVIKFISSSQKTNLPWRFINKRCKNITNEITKYDHGKSVEFSIFAYPRLYLISMSFSNKIRRFFQNLNKWIFEQKFSNISITILLAFTNLPKITKTSYFVWSLAIWVLKCCFLK